MPTLSVSVADHLTIRRRYQSHLRECAQAPPEQHLMSIPLFLRTVKDRAARSNKDQQGSKVSLIKQILASITKTSAVEDLVRKPCC